MEKIYNKIKSLDELSKIIAELKAQGKKVVQCHGVFDLIHPGHIRHLASAKNEGDVLIVTITEDAFVRKGPDRPVFTSLLRAETLAAMENVDFVAVNHAPTAVNCIEILKPDVYVKGRDYENKEEDLTGKIADEEEAVKRAGGKVVFTHDITFSSSKLINEHMDTFPKETRDYLKNIANKYSTEKIVEQLKAIEKLKVLVIGDAIVDQYFYCESMGRSLKGHIIVTKYQSDESFAGGVFATANNVSSICRHVSMLTLLGEKDDNENFVNNHLHENIKAEYFYRAGAPTTVKRRYVDEANSRKLFEICYMNDTPITADKEKEITAYLKNNIENFDLVIVSDFGHGLLVDDMIDTICSRSKFLAINVQTNSANTGFNLVSKYPRADYVSIDEPEIRLAAHEKNLNLKDVMSVIADKYDYNHLIVTRGSKGSVYYSKKNGFHEAPALALNVIDAVGAGDAYFAYTAPFMAIDAPSDLVSFIGNAVGALAVQIVCNREPVNQVNVLKFINRFLK